jgi:hypothetical protein
VSDTSKAGEGPPERPSIGADFVIPLLASALVIYYITQTFEMVWEARATGLFVGCTLLAFCAVHFVRLGRRLLLGEASPGFGVLLANTLHNRQRLALAVLVGLFVFSIEWTGTTLGVILLLVGTMLVMGVRSIPALVTIPLVTAGSIYFLLIWLLASRLPRGPIERLLASLLGIEA